MVSSLNYGIFTTDLSWKHQDLTWKERYIVISLWTGLADRLCQHVDVNPHSHRDWGNIVTQLSKLTETEVLRIQHQALPRFWHGHWGEWMLCFSRLCCADLLVWLQGRCHLTGMCYACVHVCVTVHVQSFSDTENLPLVPFHKSSFTLSCCFMFLLPPWQGINKTVS